MAKFFKQIYTIKPLDLRGGQSLSLYNKVKLIQSSLANFQKLRSKIIGDKYP